MFTRIQALFLYLTLALVAGLRGSEPVRVVSQTVGTDELLLAVADSSQVAALSYYSVDPAFCGVSEAAKQYARLTQNCDLEGVLKHRPTLLLCADYSRPEAVAQARRAGLKVLVIERYQTLADVYASLRMIARELGPEAEARAERVIATSEARVAALAMRLKGVRPIRLIAPSTYGVIPGDGTTFQDICDHCGAENLATTLGKLRGHAAPPVEQMLNWPVEKVVLAGTDAEHGLEIFRKISPYKHMAAVKEGRAVVLKPYLLSCVTHLRIDAYEQLARQLHPERFP